MKKRYSTILAVLPISVTLIVWVLQTRAMFALSQQYREFGYIEYGWFTRPQSAVAELTIVWAPLLALSGFMLTYGKLVRRFATATGFSVVRSMAWPGLSLLFLVLAVRTLLICIQGYAWIYI